MFELLHISIWKESPFFLRDKRFTPLRYLKRSKEILPSSHILESPLSDNHMPLSRLHTYALPNTFSHPLPNPPFSLLFPRLGTAKQGSYYSIRPHLRIAGIAKDEEG